MEKPLVWAHRGASGYYPENTILAYKKAAELGADGVELDVQLTKDGKLVVIHDEKVDRTTDGHGWVKDLTFDEIRALDASKTHPEAGPCQIPLMQEVFDALKDTGLTINIELKTGVYFYPDIEKMTVELTHACGYEDRVIYSSFNHYSVLKIKELDPKAKTAFLYSDGPIDMPAYGKKYGVTALHPALYNIQYPDYMEECRKAGLDVNVWTVNEEKDIRMAKNAGCHAIIGNYPDRIRRIVDEA
ncbi:MAG: glycerophosphodiester phosphodiesterase [Lachnospira sp.]|nr:glycerophosphodiester phosphodiesterase [Lachnospira sp.]